MKIERLREFRERRFLTQAELAALVGMSETTINRLERGLQEARISTVRRLADALGIAPEELVTWDIGPSEGKAAA